VTAAVVATSAFFAALSFGLLLRYRQISQSVNASTDLGRDLWAALELRMKKQDERILDMMGRFEVIQSRYSARLGSPVEQPTPSQVATGEKSQTSFFTQQNPAESRDGQMESQKTSQITRPITLDKTEVSVLNQLSAKPRTPVEVKDLIQTSREHAARLMKRLFDEGFVTRDTSKKPFVYQLTDKGRSYLAAV